MKDKFSIKVDGVERDIKMTMGLVNKLAAISGDIDGASTMAIDNDLREAALVVLLSPRDNKGKITETIDLDNIEVDQEAVLELLDWAAEHTLDFLLKALQRTKALQDRNLDRVKALMPS